MVFNGLGNIKDGMMIDLPARLLRYSHNQAYESYTSEDHICWRWIMRSHRRFFSRYASPVYLEGLSATGIPEDRIPRIEEMDEKLSRFGWGAMGVDGFLPSPVFLELLSRQVLPIATAMRQKDHIGYTPAPDIVHEAAGHAPILANEHYREFLSFYADAARRSLASKEDEQLYFAIRKLSEIKERPGVSSQVVIDAELCLQQAVSAMTFTSEAAAIGRLAWWTIEYGLEGDITNQDSLRIYGAGLLSSFSESRKCLGPNVKKIALTVGDAPWAAYDITRPQPQLYVVPHLSHLPEIIRDFSKSLSYQTGGTSSLKKAKQCQTQVILKFGDSLELKGIVLEVEEIYSGDAMAVLETLEGQKVLVFVSSELISDLSNLTNVETPLRRNWGEGPPLRFKRKPKFLRGFFANAMGFDKSQIKESLIYSHRFLDFDLDFCVFVSQLVSLEPYYNDAVLQTEMGSGLRMGESREKSQKANNFLDLLEVHRATPFSFIRELEEIAHATLALPLSPNDWLLHLEIASRLTEVTHHEKKSPLINAVYKRIADLRPLVAEQVRDFMDEEVRASIDRDKDWSNAV